jgi:hypothetical protein
MARGQLHTVASSRSFRGTMSAYARSAETVARPANGELIPSAVWGARPRPRQANPCTEFVHGSWFGVAQTGHGGGEAAWTPHDRAMSGQGSLPACPLVQGRRAARAAHRCDRPCLENCVQQIGLSVYINCHSSRPQCLHMRGWSDCVSQNACPMERFSSHSVGVVLSRTQCRRLFPGDRLATTDPEMVQGGGLRLVRDFCA